MKNINFSVVFLAILSQLIFWGASEAKAQNEATILKVAGKAEILAQGRRLPARQGQKLLPGQSVQLIGGGEVLLTSNNGKVQVKVLDNTTVKFDGDVVANSQPWDSASRFQKTSSSSPKEAPQYSVPVGKLEVRVEPGQELRVVCPLIMAAVRGTVFVVSVDLDGSSTVNTLDGRVATYGRNGEIRLTSSGQTAQVTARKYSDHLAKKGVATSGGTWRNAPRRTQERVDNETLGNIFGSEGSGVLAAVLANPDASPTDGVNALAIEESSVESGSIFVDSPIDGSLSATDSDPGRGQTLTSSVSELNPDSTLIDQGLPTLTPPQTGSSSQIGYVIGEFSLPSSLIFNNKFVFSVDMQTGRIFDAGFDIGYEGALSAIPEVSTFGGTGSVNNLAFTINNFSYSRFDDDKYTSSAPSGVLGSGTSVSGSFSGSGAMHFGQTASGSVTLDYGGASVVNLQPTYNFMGDLAPIPLLQVEGVFNLGGISSNFNQNNFEFVFDLNKSVNNIKDVYIELDYSVGIDSYYYIFAGGAGTLSGNTFNISFPTTAHGTVLANVGGTPYSIPTTGSLNGQFANANPSIGTQVVPGSGGLSIATIPPGAANSIPLGSGVVGPAGP